MSTPSNSDGRPSSSSPLNPPNYEFVSDRLSPLRDPERKPLVLVACGSFSPITYLHLRMFEMASDYIRFNSDYELVGGYLSPVSDAYKKAGLASAHDRFVKNLYDFFFSFSCYHYQSKSTNTLLHRIKMCQLAIERPAEELMVDSWEAYSKEYVPTAKVLDHFDREINENCHGIEVKDSPCGERRRAHIALLAGADLIQTMSTPGVWSDEDLGHILGRYGTFIIERAGTDIDEALASLQKYQGNIFVIQQTVQNDVSSTKVRMFLRRRMSIRYLIPADVISYIEEHQLYSDDASAGQLTSE